ncbi:MULTISPECIES: aminopeptidase P family protein [Caproicibacterium]|uniref:Aminopeptidase P family protein n=1 Tax=Caproicibacterium argilliputei TaxID=3030016 RepID=A0AA97D9U2_9FIRM|nr:aminopeptidase P family protein [Caproicibacterium argilliputei]WOC33260.1 aminopeptidase P family protein [Caproicibacterium argilliputei]
MTVAEKIEALRKKMVQYGVDAVILPTSDPHMSEYIPAHWESRRWFSGFTGDAGTLVVTKQKSLLWTDGRFFIQAEQQLAGTPIQLMRMREPGVPTIEAYLAEHISHGKVAVDGRLYAAKAAENLLNALQRAGTTLVSMDLVKDLWTADRPALPETPVYLLEERYAGKSCADKLAQVRAKLQETGADAQLYSRLDDVAWATNLRASDIACNPFAIAFLLVTASVAYLYLDAKRLEAPAAAYMKQSGVEVRPYSQLEKDLKNGFGAHKILVSKLDVSFALYTSLTENAEVEILEGTDIITALKAVKNPTECENMRICHVYDGVALVRFKRELERRMAAGETLTEWDASEIAHKYRTQMPDNRGDSFETIAAYGPNAAMMHYGPTAEVHASLQPKGFLLVDSGGQYLTGTTDVTRTFAMGPLTQEEKECFTWVLKAHIDLADAKFPQGTTGKDLDAISRVQVWKHGLDYRCGTGHGVGYMGAVHEGPQGFRDTVALVPGMSITDEPGLYMEGRFGIRTENTLEIVEDEKTEYGQFYAFRPLTLFPIDRAAILPELLSPEEMAYLNHYHQHVYTKLAPELTADERAWLKNACAPLEK